MQKVQGKSVTGGVAVGKIFLYRKKEQSVKRMEVKDAEAEVRRFREAVQVAVSQLKEIYEKSVKTVGKADAEVFEAQQMLLLDEGFTEAVETLITGESVDACYAVSQAAERFCQMFAEMEDAYMRERAADVRDVAGRLLAVLSGKEENRNILTEPSIILADDLTPAETVQLARDKVLAFVTVRGSLYSHAAILARTMGVPALVATQIPLSDNLHGKMAVVDGESGIFYVEPDRNILSAMERRIQDAEEKKALLQALSGKENVTRDGRKIQLYANIGSKEDLEAALQNDAGGIGLFRTEFLYLEKETYPTEEEQFDVYRTVAEAMAGKEVIIRTLDIGADKQVPYFSLEKEENPAMGFRAIRICLTRKEIFKTQLRAIYRASAYGNIAVMYPMIISVEEIKKIRAIVTEVKKELDGQKIPYGQVKQGIMIETPAAAIMSDELAKEVDFFSIGTNDLTQYTLAIDRQNTQLDAFYDPHHPAVLRMIRMVVENAHKAAIRVGICGELGADSSLTREFLEMGVDELSVSPGRILPLRKKILETDLGHII